MVQGYASWNRFLALLAGFLIYGSVSRADTPPCNQHTAPVTNCTCDLRSLHPLQGAVGMEEVRDKAAKITRNPDKEMANLADDPIKMVLGPGGDMFVTDHHHGARAWLLAGYTSGICSIERDPVPRDDPNQFWAELEQRRKVHLADKDGVAITPAALPTSLEQLPDDPYRTLAWMVRKEGGFCRALMPQKEFAEFLWADWMRAQDKELPPAKVVSSPAGVLQYALDLVKGSDAKSLPGYRGKQPGFTCPKD